MTDAGSSAVRELVARRHARHGFTPVLRDPELARQPVPVAVTMALAPEQRRRHR
jgi:hypothetical protein